MSAPRAAVLISVACTALVTANAIATPPRTGIAPVEKRSGLTFQAEQTRSMQSDPHSNPGMLWVAEGASLWERIPAGGKACSGCHGKAEHAMRGVATRYPAVDTTSRALENLEGRINRCRREQQGQPPYPYESDELLSLTSFVAHQSAGVPINVAIDGAAVEYFERGRAFYYERQGQLNLACAHCHEDNWGRRLRGELVSQGHGNGYPLYRLQWQSVGSLHRRFKVCSAGVRAVMYEYGSPEYLALELFLAWRASPLVIETPAVRR